MSPARPCVFVLRFLSVLWVSTHASPLRACSEWTAAAVARAAPHPRASVVGQDFFDLSVIPADTDFRIMASNSMGHLPGIDVAMVLDAAAYHTDRDTTARIRRGTVQGMGDNAVAVVREFARVLAQQVQEDSVGHGSVRARGGVYFDILGTALVTYGYDRALLLHNAPLLMATAAAALDPRNLAGAGAGDVVRRAFKRLAGLFLGGLLSFAVLVVGTLAPAAFAVARVLVTGRPLVWFRVPWVGVALSGEGT